MVTLRPSTKTLPKSYHTTVRFSAPNKQAHTPAYNRLKEPPKFIHSTTVSSAGEAYEAAKKGELKPFNSENISQMSPTQSLRAFGHDGAAREALVKIRPEVRALKAKSRAIKQSGGIPADLLTSYESRAPQTETNAWLRLEQEAKQKKATENRQRFLAERQEKIRSLRGKSNHQAVVQVTHDVRQLETNPSSKIETQRAENAKQTATSLAQVKDIPRTPSAQNLRAGYGTPLPHLIDGQAARVAEQHEDSKLAASKVKDLESQLTLAKKDEQRYLSQEHKGRQTLGNYHADLLSKRAEQKRVQPSTSWLSKIEVPAMLKRLFARN